MESGEPWGITLFRTIKMLNFRKRLFYTVK